MITVLVVRYFMAEATRVIFMVVVLLVVVVGVVVVSSGCSSHFRFTRLSGIIWRHVGPAPNPSEAKITVER